MVSFLLIIWYSQVAVAVVLDNLLVLVVEAAALAATEQELDFQ
jgi:hypothetical protein